MNEMLNIIQGQTDILKKKDNIRVTSGFLAKMLLVMTGWLIALNAFPATITSTATGGNWNTGSSWVGGTVPAATDNVIIASGATITINAGITCVDLTVHGSLLTTNNNRVVTVNGDLWVSSTGDFNIRRCYPLTVNGTTTIDGSVTDNNDNGSAVFMGLVSVSNTGSFSTANSSAFTFAGGITNDGIVSQTGTGAISFTADQSLGGTGTISLAGNVTISNGITVTNQTDVSLTRVLNGGNASSAWVNATNATLNYSSATSPMVTGLLSASASPNTVNYTGTNQTVKATTYHNLILSGSGTKTISGATQVNETLALNGVTLAVGANTITTNAVTSSGTNTITISTGTFTVDNDLSLATTNPITFTGAGTLNVSGNLTCGTLTGSSATMNIGGDFVPNTFTYNTSTVNLNGSGTQAISGLVFYNLTLSGGGAKTLQGAASVSRVLTLSSGILQLGDNNLTITNTAAVTTSITGTFGAASMIETNGNGYLAVSATTNNNSFNGTYPVGNGAYYEPVVISGLTGMTSAARRIYIRSVPANPGVFGNSINKYWDLTGTTNITVGTATISFQYDEAEVTGEQAILQPYTNTSGTWQLAAGASAAGVNPMTSTGNAGFAGLWTAGASRTYYSYRSGAWDQPDTWTSDPGGTTQVGTTIPGNFDNVVVLEGRSVSLSSDIASTDMDITIEGGGILDLSTYAFTNTLTSLSGQGFLRLASASFPAAITNTFVNAGGGTAEYYANINLPVTQTTYNNLTINTSGTAIQVGDITLNGNLYIESGTFQINDNTAQRLKLTINGNVTVDAGAAIRVGTGVTNTVTSPAAAPLGGTAPFISYYDQQSHRVVINGDLVNNGTVRFTNLDYPVFNAFPPTSTGTTTGFASVYFQGLTDNVLTCNGITDFYNLIIDKGTDQTYKLTVYSSAYSNFRLFGANTAAFDITNPVATYANPNIKKALWIRNGSLVLTGMTVIPSLSEGTTTGTPSGDYFIPANGALVLNSIDVIVLATADDYGEVNVAYGVSGGTGLVNGTGLGGASALSVLGKLRIDKGYLSTRESAGLRYWNYNSGQFIMNGGTFDAKQIGDALGGITGLMAYIQNGGNVLLRGRFQHNPAYSTVSDLVSTSLNTARATNGILGTVGTLNLGSNAANGFTMTGGNISIYDVCGTTAPTIAFQVNCQAANINVTGGTVQLLPTAGTALADAAYHLINTTASVGNLTVNRGTGCTSVVQLNTYPLTVLKNITLQSGILDANALDVSIGGNFTIANNTTYTCTGTSANRTKFNGTGTQTFTVNLGAALELNKLMVYKTSTDALVFAGSQNTVNIADSIIINKGYFNDGGKTINISGNMYHAGTHMGSGKIVLNGANTQSVTGDASGVFNNIDLDNSNTAAAPVSLEADISITGTLNLVSNKIFDIASYNLNLGTTGTITSTPGYSNSCYIHTNGQAGDGGITKTYTANTAFTFPVGSFSTSRAAVYAYTPATIGFNTAPATYGAVTVIPVGYEHPNTTTKGKSLTYFWRIKSSGFTGIAANSVTHSFTYSPSDVVGTEADYIPTLYNRSAFAWNNGANANPPINTTTNVITDWATPSNSADFLDADYTAGDNAFGVPTIYYSRQSGLWSNVNTWSLTNTNNHDPASNPAATVVPGQNDIVIIGGNDSVYLATHNTTANTDPRSCASLQIEKGSALDIGYNPASNFGMVLNHPGGNGNFRLTTSWTSGSTYTFPSGDFSDFNENLGTTELYSTNPTAGTTYWLPNGVSSYGNLILSPLGGSNIIFPNNDLTIYGDLITRGQNADSWFCPTWNGNYPTAPVTRVAKTITIKGNMDIQGGALIWYGNGSIRQDFVIYGNVTVATLSALYVYSGGANQSMSIGGSLINNTDGLSHGLSTIDKCDFTSIPLTFFGSTSASITNTAGNPTTVFAKVTINKGTSQATTLTCDIAGTLSTPADNWLTLQNGTFRYMRTNPATDFTISAGTAFTIPATAGLYIDYSNSGNKNVLIANSSSNTNDLYLNGKLTLVNGNVYVGPVAAPSYNNDIEYSNAGSSEIEVQNGKLVVNGQIRRNPSDASGILKYTQSGGSVTINGNNATANNNNAKLEVLNTGSSFSMSNSATLTLVRGGGATYGDLYLRPETGSVTGGTIIFNTSSTGAQTYSLDANIDLNNIIVTGTSGNPATVKLMISPLVVNGDFTLTNAYSVLDATNGSNSIDVTFNGNLVNGGGTSSYIYGANLTTFSAKAALPYSGAQSITGATNFYDVSVKPVAALNVNNNLIVYHDMTTSGSGQTQMSANTITVKGDVAIDASYDCDAATGGLILSGTTQQHIAGTGIFGRLELDNAAGVKLDNDITLQKNLKLTTGILNINQYLLTLQQTSEIEGSGFGAAKMITSDGVYSNAGIKKYFAIGATPTFTYPLGVSGKYTPAALTITANNSVGSVRINTINDRHPATLSPYRVLKYFWEVESTGISGFTGTLKLTYSPDDVLQASTDEANYVAARLLSPDQWSKAAAGAGTDNVDETAHQVTFNFTGVSSLTSDCTAGTDDDIPATVPAYVSNADGDWTDNTIWTPVGSSVPCPVGGPNGYIVTINHVVTANADNCFAYRTTINDTLKIPASYSNHNLGTVEGSGTLYMENGVLPAGKFTSFFDCTNGGTLEYSGTSDYILIADRLNIIPTLLFTGTGTRILPDKDLTICKQLKIDGPTLDNTLNNRKLTIMGTMERYHTGAFKCGTGDGATVSFAGTLAQTMGGTLGDFSGTNAFNNLEINNSAGLTINTNGVIDVGNELLLTNGLITTTSTNKLTLTGTSVNTVEPVGGSASSYIDGPLIKKLNPSDGEFIFPVGKGSNPGNKLTITSASTGPMLWTVEYFTPNTTYTSFNTPLSAVDSKDYWTVTPASSGQAYIGIIWDDLTDITPLMTENGLSDMRVAGYISPTWNEITSTATGDNYDGEVSTASRVTVSTSGTNYTIASVNSIKPKARLAPTGPVCGASSGIPVTFNPYGSVPLNYTITYSIDGVTQAPVTVTSLPYVLPTPSTGVYQLIGFMYNNGANSGVVDVSTVTVYDIPTTSSAGTDQSKCGATTTILAANTPGTGSGLWSIVSGAGGTIVSPISPTSTFNGANGSSYTLRWTISNGGCTSSDDVVINFTLLPAAPVAAATQSFCGNAVVADLAASASAGCTIYWYTTATGGIALAGATSLVSGNYYAEADNGCQSLTRTPVTVTINPAPATGPMYRQPNQ